MENTAERTVRYINEHPHIKWCLKKELVNLSSLARIIAHDLRIEKQTSKAAIVVAAARYSRTLRKDITAEKNILMLLANSSLEVKTKMAVYTVAKNMSSEAIASVQREIHADAGTCYFVEGSRQYTIIMQEKYRQILTKLRSHIIKEERRLALIVLTSSPQIEKTPGVCAYLTSLFFQNGINIVELASCATDTLFIIEQNDIKRALDFLHFAE